MQDPYTYIIYNPLKDGEFATVAKKLLHRKKKVKKSTVINKKPKEVCNYKLTRNDPFDALYFKTEKSTTTVYSFPKATRKLTVPNKSNDKRFSYNPRKMKKDPYTFTHYK